MCVSPTPVPYAEHHPKEVRVETGIECLKHLSQKHETGVCSKNRDGTQTEFEMASVFSFCRSSSREDRIRVPIDAFFLLSILVGEPSQPTKKR